MVTIKSYVSEPGKPLQTVPVAVNDNDPKADKPLAIVPALDFEESQIPLRQWIIPGLLIRKHLSVLVAPPGAGKSLLTLQLGLTAALGDEWGGFRPREPYNVLVVNAEDDVDEMRRRLAGSLRSMEIDKASIADRIYLAEDPRKIVVAQTDPRTKTVTRLPLVDEMVKLVKDKQIDVLVIDPFAETFEGDENSNSEVKWAAAIWRDVARDTNAAVLLVHHVSKALSSAPGDMNAARGGGALVGVARSVSTLFAMSEADGKTMGVAEKDRHRFVRFDDAKANLTLVTGAAKWFRKESLRLSNGTIDQPGDEVGVLVPWEPPSLMDGISTASANAILDDLANGVLDDDGNQAGVLWAYTDSKRGPRWAGHVIIRHVEMTPERAGQILKTWKKNSVIAETEYHDPGERKPKKGIRVIDENRPGRVSI